MLDVCLLGTGGMMPLPYRWLTSLMVRYNGSSLLIDCGEGTQIAIKEKGWSFKPIDVICFTHYHGDHISGLPGLLLTMEIDRAGKFDVERAKASNIPQEYWGLLQKGETIETKRHVYTPNMVLGPARKGIKLTYTTDTRPTESIKQNAKHSDLFICEGMYGEKDKQKKAKEYKHMTFYEAAQLAKEAEVKEMWLTHYSPSLTKPEEYMDDVKAIFPNSIAAKDKRSVELVFED